MVLYWVAGIAETSKITPVPSTAETSKITPVPSTGETSKTTPVPSTAETSKTTPVPSTAETSKTTPVPSTAETSKTTPVPSTAETSKITPVPSTAATKIPVLPDLEVTDINKEITDPVFVAALPSGEAAVVNTLSQVLKINQTGHTVKVLYNCNSCNNIGGLILLGNYLYVVHDNGTIAQIHPHTVQVQNVYQIPNVDKVEYHCSLWLNPSEIPNTGILHLTDSERGEVFSYNLTSRVKQVHVTGLAGPLCVSYIFSDGSTRYIVAESYKTNIYIFNSSWGTESKFGAFGFEDGQLFGPYAAIMSSNNSILVPDFENRRISVFTTKGEFLHHLLTNIAFPYAISYYEPYLWVKHSTGNKPGLYRISPKF